MMKAERKGGWRWLRRLARVTIVLVGALIISLLIFDHYLEFRRSDKELKRIFAEYGLDARIGYYTSQGRTLRYAVAGADSLPTLLMIHGSPGSMSYYGRRFADSILRGKFRMIAVDRPGYGYSGLGEPEPSIQKQAAMIRPLLDSLFPASRPVILVAGSYGAPIACRLAMDHPSLVDGMVLSGPALGPGRETYFWFTHLIEHWSIRWFIPRSLRSANTEKVHHRAELEKMMPFWKNIKVPVAYLQGEFDDIVDTSNASFAREQLINAHSLDINIIKGRYHPLVQFEWDRIRGSILDVYRKIRPANNSNLASNQSMMD